MTDHAKVAALKIINLPHAPMAYSEAQQAEAIIREAMDAKNANLQAQNQRLADEITAGGIEYGEVCKDMEEWVHDDETVAEAILRLRAIVDKLPKTADGVPITPGMTVWQRPGLIAGKEWPPRESTPVLCGPFDDSPEGDHLLGEVEDYVFTFFASDCYSTCEAAEAAKERRDV